MATSVTHSEAGNQEADRRNGLLLAVGAEARSRRSL